MFKKLVIITISLAVAAVAAACTGTPRLYQHWGQSVQTAKTRQTANPQASREAIQPTEMDGKAAGHAVDGYRQSFIGRTGQ